VKLLTEVSFCSFASVKNICLHQLERIDGAQTRENNGSSQERSPPIKTGKLLERIDRSRSLLSNVLFNGPEQSHLPYYFPFGDRQKNI
jgi:hypothetical protein